MKEHKCEKCIFYFKKKENNELSELRYNALNSSYQNMIISNKEEDVHYCAQSANIVSLDEDRPICKDFTLKETNDLKSYA